MGDGSRVSVTYKELYKELRVGSRVLIDDGRLELRVESVEGC